MLEGCIKRKRLQPKNVENPEIVYITAHYDSVAFSPGANDDASGTSVVLEIARLLITRRKSACKKRHDI